MSVLVRTATIKNRVSLTSDFLKVGDPSLCKCIRQVVISHYKLSDTLSDSLHKVSASRDPSDSSRRRRKISIRKYNVHACYDVMTLSSNLSARIYLSRMRSIIDYEVTILAFFQSSTSSDFASLFYTTLRQLSFCSLLTMLLHHFLLNT